MLNENKIEDGLLLLIILTTYDGKQLKEGYNPLFHDKSLNSIHIYSPLDLFRFQLIKGMSTSYYFNKDGFLKDITIFQIKI